MSDTKTYFEYVCLMLIEHHIRLCSHSFCLAVKYVKQVFVFPKFVLSCYLLPSHVCHLPFSNTAILSLPLSFALPLSLCLTVFL